MSEQSESLSTSPRTVTADCPAGKRAVGAGASVTGGGQIVFEQILPSVATAVPGFVMVTAYEGTATTLNWTLHAFAICANAS